MTKISKILFSIFCLSAIVSCGKKSGLILPEKDENLRIKRYQKIEEKILEPHINYLTGTNTNIEYRDLLNNQKETL